MQPDSAAPVLVLLVDDHAVCREGVRAMLAHTEFRIVREVETLAEALDAVREQRPDIIILELRTAQGSGLRMLRELRQAHPDVPVVVLTLINHPVFIAAAVAEGAADYLPKGCQREDLLRSLRAVARGETPLVPDELVRRFRETRGDAEAASELIRPLSEREWDVTRLLGSGLSNQDIARLLFISETTVKTHIEHVIRKLGVRDRTQAAVWAARLPLDWNGAEPHPAA